MPDTVPSTRPSTCAEAPEITRPAARRPADADHPDRRRPAAGRASDVTDGEIRARGVPIGDLIGSAGYVDMLFFQLLDRYPTEQERAMTEAYLVSLCEHGVTSPSTHGARVAASVRAPFASCAVSFIAAASGPYHFGALERAMDELGELERTGEDPARFVDRRLASGTRVWGYGHRFHKSAGAPPTDPGTLARLGELADPRVRRLIEVADALGWDRPHLRRVRAVGRLLYGRKRIPINIDGVGAGLLLDMGFDPETALLFVMIGRLPNIARLYAEEHRQTPNRFVALATRDDPGFDRTTDRDQD